MSADHPLTSMTVSLPKTQKAYVKAQANATGCSTPSEYIRRLIHQDQRAHAESELERKILEGLDSPTREITPEDWRALKATMLRKLSDRRESE